MREHIEQLEADLAAAREANAEAAKAVRENAMLRAGVNLDSPVGAMFAKAYDGELNADAIKDEAVKVGALTTITPTTEPTTTTTPTAEEQQLVRDRQVLTAEGAPAGQAAGGEPIEESYEGFRAGMAKGESREKAAGAVFGRFIAEANGGNPDFKYTPEGWRQRQKELAGE
jgi:hypothetical protein